MSFFSYRMSATMASMLAVGVGTVTALGMAAYYMYGTDSLATVSRGAFDWDRTDSPDISDADLAFLSAYTGESDLAALKKRLLAWWKKIKRQAHVYRCIQEMMFLVPKIDQHKAYKALLYKAHKGHPDFRVADVGCCFGQDVRRMLLDGVPANNIWAIDLTSIYWEASKELYKDDASVVSRVSGVHTLFGDMAAVPMTPSAIDLEGHQLLGSFSFVVAMAVVHCMSREKSERFLSRCLSMLSPKGVLFGWCVGSSEPHGATWCATGGGDRHAVQTRFLHSKETLATTLEEAGFVDVEVVQVVSDRIPPEDVGRVRLGFIAKRAG